MSSEEAASRQATVARYQRFRSSPERQQHQHNREEEQLDGSNDFADPIGGAIIYRGEDPTKDQIPYSPKTRLQLLRDKLVGEKEVLVAESRKRSKKKSRRKRNGGENWPISRPNARNANDETSEEEETDQEEEDESDDEQNVETNRKLNDRLSRYAAAARKRLVAPPNDEHPSPREEARAATTQKDDGKVELGTETLSSDSFHYPSPHTVSLLFQLEETARAKLEAAQADTFSNCVVAQFNRPVVRHISQLLDRSAELAQRCVSAESEVRAQRRALDGLELVNAEKEKWCVADLHATRQELHNERERGHRALELAEQRRNHEVSALKATYELEIGELLKQLKRATDAIERSNTGESSSNLNHDTPSRSPGTRKGQSRSGGGSKSPSPSQPKKSKSTKTVSNAVSEKKPVSESPKVHPKNTKVKKNSSKKRKSASRRNNNADDSDEGDEEEGEEEKCEVVSVSEVVQEKKYLHAFADQQPAPTAGPTIMNSDDELDYHYGSHRYSEAAEEDIKNRRRAMSTASSGKQRREVHSHSPQDFVPETSDIPFPYPKPTAVDDEADSSLNLRVYDVDRHLYGKFGTPSTSPQRRRHASSTGTASVVSASPPASVKNDAQSERGSSTIG